MAAKQHTQINVKSIAIKLVLTFSACFMLSMTHGQIYKKVDEKGNVTFTDQPDPDAVSVEIREPNRSTAIEPRPRPEDIAPPPMEAVSYTQLAITHPANGSVIANGLVPLPVATAVSPKLDQDHALQLLLDGQVHSESKSGTFTLPSVPRGSHTLQVRVVDEENKTIKQSATTSIQVYRPGG